MFFSKITCAVALSAAVAYASPEVQEKRSPKAAAAGGNAAAAAGGNGATGTTLLANAIQSGSFVDGSKQIGAAEVGQALSATSTNNFINFCSGKTLTNGLQIVTGSCNGIPMGDIPAKTSMISAIILNPTTGGTQIQSDTTFDIEVQMINLEAGAFTNADATYYAAPQALKGGKVVGHTHVTVQDMGANLNPTTPLDPVKFAFFKGINDAGNGQGLLKATVTGGLPAGNYRVCTMTSASNHQPVLMPVAQRGTPDDCTKFVVGGNGKVANAAANDGSGGIAAAAAAQSAVDAGPGAVDTAAAAAATAASSTSAAAAKGGKGGNAAATSAAAATTAAAAKGGKGGAKAAATAASSSAAAVDTATAAAAKGGKGGAKAAATVASSSTSSAAATASTAAAAAKGGKGFGQGFGKGGRKQRARRVFIA